MDGDRMPIYDAAMRYKAERVPLVIFGGKECMGVLPLTFKEGMDRMQLNLSGDELIDILGLHALSPRMDLALQFHRTNGTTDTVPVTCRIDTVDEIGYYQHGGILQYVLRQMAKAA